MGDGVSNKAIKDPRTLMGYFAPPPNEAKIKKNLLTNLLVLLY